MNPKISVVTVCFNAVDSIGKTILSVINQTYQNIEYVIIDGGSTDGTLDIIQKYAKSITCWISEPDNGIYDAMNKGLKIANGDFLIFVGSDDVFYNDSIIEGVVNHIKEYNMVSIVYYGNVLFSENNHLHWGSFNKWKWGIANICHQAIFYPKSIYKNYQYDLNYIVYADYVYNLNLLQSGVSFAYIDIITMIFCINGFSSRTIDYQFEKDKLKLIKNAVGICPMILGVIYRQALKLKLQIFA